MLNIDRNLIFLIILALISIFLLENSLSDFSKKSNISPESVSLFSRQQKIMTGQKKVVLIIAFKDFRDEEFFTPKAILEQAGADISVASNKLGLALGSQGGEVNVDITLDALTIENFSAIVFIGGEGALSSLDNETSYNIAKKAVKENKILGAICISPVILAKSGVLKDKKATVWSSTLDKSAVKMLEANGAIFEDKNVVIDGKIITGNGPQAAQEFGEKLVALIINNQ